MIAHLLLSPLVFWDGTVDHFEPPKVSLLFLTVLLLAGAGLGRAVSEGAVPFAEALRSWASRLRRDPVALAALLFCASAIVSTLASIAPRVSLFGARSSLGGLTTIGALTALFFATRVVLGSGLRAKALLVVPFVAGGYLGTYACLQAAGLDPIRWQGASLVAGVLRPFATLGHANHLGGYLAMTMPVSAVVSMEQVRARRRPGALVAGYVLIVQVGAVVLTLSRGAWIAGCASLLALAALGAVARPRQAMRLGPAFLGIVAAAIMVPFLSGGSRFHGGVLERLHRFGESSRAFYWEAAGAIFREHPWTGSGLDTFQLAFLKHRDVANWVGGVGRGLGEWGQTPARAHSEPLQVLATQGGLGAVALASLLASLVWAGMRAWRRSAPGERPLVAAIIAGLAGFCCQAAIDFSVVATASLFVTFAACLSRLAFESGTGRDERPSVDGRRAAVLLGLGGSIALAVLVLQGLAAPLRLLLATSILLGVSLLASIATGLAGGPLTTRAESAGLQPDPRSTTRPSRPRWLKAGAWGLVALATSLAIARGIVKPLRADFFCRQGIQQTPLQPEAAVASLAWSTSLAPDDDFCLAKLGIAAEAAADVAKEPPRRLEALEAARRAFRKAVELVPQNAYHHANQGRALAKLVPFGRATSEEALGTVDRGLARDPNNADLLYGAANTALAMNDLAKAELYARQALARVPGFAPCQAQLGFLALMRSEPDPAASLLREALLGDWRGRDADRVIAEGNLASALLQLGRAEEALPFARAAAEGAPTSADLRFNLARALDMGGHREEALAEYRRLIADFPALARARRALAALEARSIGGGCTDSATCP
ncbi:MAG: O-antigen ligase family protein [Deltaproteobacteria bacterium]|nr:O-antigen ligase family protein [Deltaproteobacteria bacterium]